VATDLALELTSATSNHRPRAMISHGGVKRKQIDGERQCCAVPPRDTSLAKCTRPYCRTSALRPRQHSLGPLPPCLDHWCTSEGNEDDTEEEAGEELR
jgi:hypothetical protein